MANRGLIRSGGAAKKWKPMTSVGVKRNLAMSGKLHCYFLVLGIKDVEFMFTKAISYSNMIWTRSQQRQPHSRCKSRH